MKLDNYHHIITSIKNDQAPPSAHLHNLEIKRPSTSKLHKALDKVEKNDKANAILIRSFAASSNSSESTHSLKMIEEEYDQKKT